MSEQLLQPEMEEGFRPEVLDPGSIVERLNWLRQQLLDVAKESDELAHQAVGISQLLSRDAGDLFLPPKLTFMSADGPVEVLLASLTKEQYQALVGLAEFTIDARYLSVWDNAHRITSEAVDICARWRGVPVAAQSSPGGPNGHGQSNETREAQQARSTRSGEG